MFPLVILNEVNNLKIIECESLFNFVNIIADIIYGKA